MIPIWYGSINTTFRKWYLFIRTFSGCDNSALRRLCKRRIFFIRLRFYSVDNKDLQRE